MEIPPIQSIPYESPGAEAPFKTLRTGAICFGVLAIVMGAFAGCLGLMAPISLLMPQPASAAPPQRPGDIISGALTFIATSAALVWLGIGAARMRRWVRPLVLTFGTLTLLGGAYALIIMALTLPVTTKAMSTTPAGSPAPPPGFVAVMIAVAFGFVAIVGVIVPGAFVWFYKKPNVRAMLEYYDPTPRWTDHCPLQVLAVSVTLAMCAIMYVLSLPAAVAPIFGTVLTGLPAIGIVLVEAAISVLLARSVYRLRPAGWWGTVIFVIALTLFYAMTTFHPDQPDLYRRAGFSEQQVAAMQAVRSTRREIVLLWLPAFAATVGYLIYVRKFFPTPHQTL